MEQLNLVIGANSHLGNNLVRELLNQRRQVQASVRNTSDQRPFKGLTCEIVRADIMDRQSLVAAMERVDALYLTAAYHTSPSDQDVL